MRTLNWLLAASKLHNNKAPRCTAEYWYSLYCGSVGLHFTPIYVGRFVLPLVGAKYSINYIMFFRHVKHTSGDGWVAVKIATTLSYSILELTKCNNLRVCRRTLSWLSMVSKKLSNTISQNSALLNSSWEHAHIVMSECRWASWRTWLL